MDADYSMASAATEFRQSGLAAAVVVAADALHEAVVPSAAAVLKDAGAQKIVVAGRPGEHEATFRRAGVTDFLFAGADACQFLNELFAGMESRHGRS
jgi:methylmalonyl-CoA mutase